jgi:hypothetical protein
MADVLPALPVNVVGVAHVAGKYNFTDEGFLNEGADQLHELGCRVIKVWMTHLQRSYPFNSNWPRVKSLTEMARTPDFKRLFESPFETFILEAFCPSRADDYWLGGMSAGDVDAEMREFHEFAAYLLEMYKESGKTFILQNWEGDWALRGGAPGKDPSPQAVEGMIAWLNARQDGVDAARKKAGDRSGVRVLHAAEVNHVGRAMKSEGVTVTNDVLPHTHCDLYSYSAWDVPTHEPDKFTAALNHLASKAPGGKEKVYVGEFGAPENVVGSADKQLEHVKSTIETAMKWGAKYAVYWELYCNEFKEGQPPRGPNDRPKKNDLRGFWLIRPDGSRPPVCDYFIELWNRQQ